MAAPHAYPEDLARFVLDANGPGFSQFSFVALSRLLSVAFQASLMRDEARPVTFRLAIASPEAFDPDAGPPNGHHRLKFDRPRPFEPQVLRRLAQAVDFRRGMIGVVEVEDTFRIWGLLHSGALWLQPVRGGRRDQALPEQPIVHVRGPGQLLLTHGRRPIATLSSGRVDVPARDVFDSKWLPALFAPIREELMNLHEAARNQAQAPWARLDASLAKTISQHMVRRLLATIRESQHGGTVLIMPVTTTDRLLEDASTFRVRFRFDDPDPARRFRHLILEVMNTLARTAAPDGPPIGWPEYQASRNARLGDLDEAIFEFAHLVAGLANIDGAVLLNQRFELMGFGVVIAGGLPEVETVARALDVEGQERIRESTEAVGTRHRAVYRLCAAHPEALGIVVSQDGGIRFVRRVDNEVVYWNQVKLGSHDI
ncbi:MAG: putative sensor domain DACNV-containing protein [Myxococcota bacterium]